MVEAAFFCFVVFVSFTPQTCFFLFGISFTLHKMLIKQDPVQNDDNIILRIIINVYNLRIYKMWMKEEKQKCNEFWIVFNDHIEFDKTRTGQWNSNENQPNWHHSHLSRNFIETNHNKWAECTRKGHPKPKISKWRWTQDPECEIKNYNLIQNEKRKIVKAMIGVI